MAIDTKHSTHQPGGGLPIWAAATVVYLALLLVHADSLAVPLLVGSPAEAVIGHFFKATPTRRLYGAPS